MNLSNLLNEISNSSSAMNYHTNGAGGAVSNLANKIPGGLVGGAVSGGLVALLVGNKSARKTLGTAAKYGGAAVLGGLAYKAYKNWQMNSNQPSAVAHHPNVQSLPQAHIPGFESEALEHSRGVQTSVRFDFAIIKAMVASARADGSIDQQEQLKIAEAIDKMNLDASEKNAFMDLFTRPISIDEIICEARTVEQKAELYLASCLAINLDHEAEYAHLSALSRALNLPLGLEHQLRAQARGAVNASV